MNKKENIHLSFAGAWQKAINGFMLIALAVIVSSCSTTGGGAMTGAMFGGIIGSSIGGISGGHRGHDVGTLVGMAVGAGTGAAIGAAAEADRRDRYESRRGRDYDGYDYDYDEMKDRVKDRVKDSGYSEKPVYDDVIDFDTDKKTAQATTPDANMPPAVVEVSQDGATFSTPVVVENARFINDAGTTHIAKGELVKISFEIRNVSRESIYGIVPMIRETTGNKHLLISPSTMIESLGARRAIRYTAYVSAERTLKKGSAHFVVSAFSGNKQISNTIEFDVPLN